MSQGELNDFDLRTASRRALNIVKGSDFSKAEAKDSFKIISRFAYTEIKLDRNLRSIDSKRQQKAYRKKFQVNIKKTTASLTRSSGKGAARKFRSYLRDNQSKGLQASL